MAASAEALPEIRLMFNLKPKELIYGPYDRMMDAFNGESPLAQLRVGERTRIE